MRSNTKRHERTRLFQIMLHLTSLTFDLCHMTSCHITKLKWLTVNTICFKNKLETKYYHIFLTCCRCSQHQGLAPNLLPNFTTNFFFRMGLYTHMLADSREMIVLPLCIASVFLVPKDSLDISTYFAGNKLVVAPVSSKNDTRLPLIFNSALNAT